MKLLSVILFFVFFQLVFYGCSEFTSPSVGGSDGIDRTDSDRNRNSDNDNDNDNDGGGLNDGNTNNNNNDNNDNLISSSDNNNNDGIDWDTPYWRMSKAQRIEVFQARWEALLGVNNPLPGNPYWDAAWNHKEGGVESVMFLTLDGTSGYDAVDPNTGNTVLHVFSAAGSHHNVAMLRRFGVNEKVTNHNGKQAWELWGLIATALAEPDNTEYKEEMRQAAIR